MPKSDSNSCPILTDEVVEKPTLTLKGECVEYVTYRSTLLTSAGLPSPKSAWLNSAVLGKFISTFDRESSSTLAFWNCPSKICPPVVRFAVMVKIY
ncbi:hypothetical protein [Nostoc sp.]|uniref:hypothetical protein n=1 Tax=Nostoc sp. TaxID=1180 RepID=UPI003FA5C73A